MRARIAVVTALVALAPLAADAQSFRCVGTDGKKYYGSTIPPQCSGQVIEQLNSQGMVIRRIDPAGDEKAREAKEAELAKKREQDAAAKEAARRNRALLATYASDKDIDEARARALAANDKQVKEIQTRIDNIKKRQAGYDKEMEFYKEAPSAKGKPPAKVSKPPAKLIEDMQQADMDLKAQQGLLAAKQKEVEGINAKYDEDKKRYQELTGKGPKR
ncbi:MAG TPA: hypothetical protein VD965_02410 [Burkholderiales bacterium]|nr:hypothetical protein [Burkholderiales bacterium]